MLLIGKPMPIRPLDFSELFSLSALAPCHLPTCSSTVARRPCLLELAVRSAPKRESSSLVAFLTWENEKRSAGLDTGPNAFRSPPPTQISEFQ